MNDFLKRIPLPVTGLSLAIATLGNLLLVTPKMAKTNAIFQSLAPLMVTARFALHMLSAIIFLLVTIKVVLNFSDFKKEMETPIIASVFLTYAMNLILLAAWLKAYSASIATALWYFGIALYLVLMLYFMAKFLFKFDLKKVFPSWFIAFVGIACASVTAPNFNNLLLGKIFVYWGLAWLLLLFVLVLLRYKKHSELPEQAKPLIAIFAAPLALCLAGYINSFEVKNIPLLWAMFIGSQLLFVFALVKVASFLGGKFFPSFSAFTFPFVISALSAKLSLHALYAKASFGFQTAIIAVESLLATFIVFYVLVLYIKATCKKKN